MIIRGGAAKLRQRRTVELHDTAIKWLTLCNGQPIIAPRRLLDAAKRAAGYAARVEEGGDMPTWPPDALLACPPKDGHGKSRVLLVKEKRKQNE